MPANQAAAEHIRPRHLFEEGPSGKIRRCIVRISPLEVYIGLQPWYGGSLNDSKQGGVGAWDGGGVELCQPELVTAVGEFGQLR